MSSLGKEVIVKEEVWTADDYLIDLSSDVWKLGKNESINFGQLPRLNRELAFGFRKTLSYYAENYSPSHTANMFRRFLHLCRNMEMDLITPELLINYQDKLDEERHWYLGVLKGFFLTWYKLGNAGVGKDVVDYLNRKRFGGNRKGVAVETLDPEKGPLSDLEFEAIQDRLVEALADSKITLQGYCIAQIFMATGARPRQICNLKVKDIIKGVGKGEAYFINFPRGKQRGVGWRQEFTPFSITEDLWRVIQAHVDGLVEELSISVGVLLSKGQVAELPLFPMAGLKHQNASELSQEVLETQKYHRSVQGIASTFGSTIDALNVISERTGKPINIHPKRCRYTLGSRAARAGYGKAVIAQLLDHSDTQNVESYVKNIPDFASEISQFMDAALLPVAQAFSGVLVKDEGHSIRGDDLTSRISLEEKDLGNCGSHGFCSSLAPIACYTCRYFQPWKEAPHESVLKWLVDEREKSRLISGDSGVSTATDRTIVAVAEVIKLCKLDAEGNDNG